MPRGPEHCTTMAEVRDGVDAVDEALVALIARRFGYMDAAARIKAGRTEVRDEARKAAVLAHVGAAATARGIDPLLARLLWEELIEASIAYELERWDALRAPVTGRGAADPPTVPGTGPIEG